MDAKTRAIVAYLTIIGWVIALIQNNPKDKLASFHLRQMLGIMLLGLASVVITSIPLFGWLVGLVGYFAAFILWIIGFINAINGEQKPVPGAGIYFQDWFKNL
ncbi:hypothetical protein [Pelagicoccus sp. SDUM812003]|uniref:DUF4870 domain-containing protein n=1 Tax=Pelagicoccus sp. SDUM812003 TaxID=3041267 RepID=UPI00280DCE69|nr:hypothetical protein [Pelagicoccus sp. SDUM812003]MDQ8204082.1 hypothetical protein [Pelagicoccus sp. SDUM812003]